MCRMRLPPIKPPFDLDKLLQQKSRSDRYKRPLGRLPTAFTARGCRLRSQSLYNSTTCYEVGFFSCHCPCIVFESSRLLPPFSSLLNRLHSERSANIISSTCDSEMKSSTGAMIVPRLLASRHTYGESCLLADNCRCGP